MAEGNDFRTTLVPQAGPHVEGASAAGPWKKFKHFLARSILWTYHRGGWQYDILCLLILLFIFVPPRSFFQDGPRLELTDLRHKQGFVDMGRTKEGRSYQVDARLVESLAGLSPEDAIGEILRQRVQQPFTVKSIEAIRDKNQVILGYTVVVANPEAKDRGATP
jgi:hypothetical protein